MSAAETTPRTAPSPAPGTAPGALRAGWRLLRSELRLIMSRRRNQAGMLVLAAVPVLVAIAVRASHHGGGRGGPDFFSSITSNGIFVSLAALSAEITLFLPLAVAVLTGDTVAGEANIGTLRYLLAVPVGRTRLLMTKYVSVVLGAWVGIAVVVIPGLIVGGALFGLGPVTLLSGTQVSLLDGIGRLLIASAYLGLGLAALAALGLFVSTLTEQPIGAMVAVTIVATAMWIADGIEQISWLHPWLLVNYWLSFADAFRDPVFWDSMRQGALLDAGYAVVFLALAWLRFRRKDITS